MSTSPEMEASLWAGAARLGAAVRPVVLPTQWRVGPVTAYLFCDDPVTLVDCGYDSPEARTGIEAAFAAAGRRVGDLAGIVVTHGHSDHYGCARWLQDRSGCEVLLHRLDAEDLARRDEWDRLGRELFGPLGLDDDALERFFGRRGHRGPEPPEVRAVEDGEVVDAGGTVLRLEHRPGHAPGHLWVVEERSGAVFTGDHLLAHTPTNAGLAADPEHPLGRRPMLAQYDGNLEQLASREVPVVLPGHGPAIGDHAALIRRRLDKSHRRTEHVLESLRREGPSTPLRIATALYGERIVRDPWGFLSDVTGRLDVLWADGRARARRGDDGFWWFSAADDDGGADDVQRGGDHG